MSILLLSAWCGLVAGLLEVGTIVIRKELFDDESSLRDEPPFRLADPGDEPRRLPRVGIIRVGRRSWPGRAAVAGFSTRILCALVLLPIVLIAFPRIYTMAWLAVTLGLASTSRPAPRVERPAVPAVRPGQLSRWHW